MPDENPSAAGWDARRKRLLFRSTHRGTKETDHLIGGFAERYLPRLDDSELDQFEILLELPDSDLFDWVTGRLPAPDAHHSPVLQRMIDHYRASNAT